MRVITGSIIEISFSDANLYGPGDNYHPENSHVVPALIRRFHEAKVRQETDCSGDRVGLEEFLYADDMAEASLFVHNLDKIILLRK